MSFPAARRLADGSGMAAVVAANVQTIRRVPFTRPTLMRVLVGSKQLFGPYGAQTAGAAQLIAVPAGAEIDLTNAPDARTGRYAAVFIEIGPELLRQFRAVHGVALAELLSRSASPQLILPADAAFEVSWQALQAGWEQDAADSLLSHHLHGVLLALLLAGHGHALFQPAAAPLAEQVRLLLQLDPAYAWTGEEIAQRLHRSAATLRRQLAAEGAGFRELLEAVRMSHGLGLVQSSNRPIGEIANASGYDSASKFTTRFRERFGVTPSALRESQQA